MEKKKVLILITKSNWGGAQRYVYDIATNISKEAYYTEVMAGSEGILIEKLKEANILASGTLSMGRDINLLQDIKAFFELISILRKKKPDILHLNSSKIGGLGALAGKLTGVPKVIFTSHGWAFNENRSLISRMMISFLHWITIVLADQTIAVSENLKSQMTSWPRISGKIHVIHNAIKVEPVFSRVNALQEFARLNPPLQQKFAVFDPKKTLIIGSVGELHHIKGYEYTLQAIRDIVSDQKEAGSTFNILYIIIGTGEEKEKIEKMIVNFNLSENVILLGHIKDAYLYLKSFDLFLLPSLSESFGYVLLEAGLAGLPVVATAVGGIPEIIDDMKSGILIQAKKSEEIKNSIEFYLSHKKTRKEHAKALHDKLLKDFSMEKMIAQTSELYASAL